MGKIITNNKMCSYGDGYNIYLHRVNGEDHLSSTTTENGIKVITDNGFFKKIKYFFTSLFTDLEEIQIKDLNGKQIKVLMSYGDYAIFKTYVGQGWDTHGIGYISEE